MKGSRLREESCEWVLNSGINWPPPKRCTPNRWIDLRRTPLVGWHFPWWRRVSSVAFWSNCLTLSASRNRSTSPCSPTEPPPSPRRICRKSSNTISIWDLEKLSVLLTWKAPFTGAAMLSANVFLRVYIEIYIYIYMYIHCFIEFRLFLCRDTSCYGHFGRKGFAWENPRALDLTCIQKWRRCSFHLRCDLRCFWPRFLIWGGWVNSAKGVGYFCKRIKRVEDGFRYCNTICIPFDMIQDLSHPPESAIGFSRQCVLHSVPSW